MPIQRMGNVGIVVADRGQGTVHIGQIGSAVVPMLGNEFDAHNVRAASSRRFLTATPTAIG